MDNDVESVKIAVDMREPQEMVSLIMGLGINVERKLFTPGDYVLSAEYAAERKTVADFMSSMYKGTLFEQLETLKEVYPKPLLILEGDIASRLRGRKNPRSFWGGLLRIQVDMGVPVLPTPTLHHTAELLCTLAKRLQRRRVERIAVQHKPRQRRRGKSIRWRAFRA
jgi:ERCC4-type nuclease